MVSLIALLIVVLVIASVIASQIALEYYTDQAFWVWVCIILVWVGGSYFAYSYDMGTLTPIAEKMYLLGRLGFHYDEGWVTVTQEERR
jgi:membrane protein CcdC involved in cytochrome C biogenesis